MNKIRKIVASAFVMFCEAFLSVMAQDDYYDMAIDGYVRNPIETKVGVVATNSCYSEIFVVKNGVKKTVYTGLNCGIYTNIDKSNNLLGFKSFDDERRQSPALLNLETGEVTLLEGYTKQCGQVSFSDDGKIAYTIGNVLVVREGEIRQEYPLGEYVNIANISPDGSKVAYSNIHGETTVLTLATGSSQRIELSGSAAYNAVWSPDNGKIAFEKVDETLDIYCLDNQRVYSIGRAASVKWADGESVVCTRNEGAGKMTRKRSASVVKMRFDGSEKKMLVAATEDMPTDVSVSENGDVLVSYARGERRGVRRISNRVNISETELYKIEEDEIFGKPYVMSNGKMSEQSGEIYVQKPRFRAVGGNEIPYMNQYYDCVPDYNDCTSYGAVCCASTSACMNLAYYGLLEPYALTSRYTGATVYYSYYIGRDYTSPNTGYTFSLRVEDNGCYNIGGAHGYMWYNDAGPVEKLPSFYTNNGMSNSYTSSSYATFQSETSAGRPYTICLKNSTNGHVVLGFRSDAVSDDNGNITEGYVGSFVCHDPYGDYNYTYYDETSARSMYWGNHSTYDWVGYNNGYANINEFYWGVVAIPPADTSSLTVSHSAISMSTYRGSDSSVYFTVTGKKLSNAITISNSNTTAFTVTPSTIAAEGGNVWVTLNGNLSAGTYYATLTVSSGSKSETVNVAGVVKDVPLNMTEVWNNSDAAGTRERNGWDAGSVRNFCYADGKLYCVYNHEKIKIIKAQTGDDCGEMSITDDVKGGTFRFCDVKYIDGHFVACNLALASKGEEFRVYAWESDEDFPTVLYTTTDYKGATRIGDCMEVSGTWDDLVLTFANDNGSQTIITDYKKDSSGNWSVSTRNLTTDGSTYFPIGNCARAHPYPGGYWVDGSAQYSGWAYIDSTTGNAVNSYVYNTGMVWGSIHRVLMWGSTKHCVNLVFDGVDASTPTSAYYMGGRARLSIVNSGDYSDADVVGDFPSSGLSSANQNGNATGDVVVNTDNTTYVEMWVCSTNQGMAYYTFGEVPTINPSYVTGVDGAETSDYRIYLEDGHVKVAGEGVKDVNIFTISGIKLNSSNKIPSKGVYLVRVVTDSGNVRVAKLVIK